MASDKHVTDNVARKRRFILEVQDNEQFEEESENLPVVSLSEMARCFVNSLEMIGINMCDGLPQHLEKTFILAANRGELAQATKQVRNTNPVTRLEPEAGLTSTPVAVRSHAFDLLTRARTSQLVPLNISEISEYQQEMTVYLSMPQELRKYVPIAVSGDGNCLYRSLAVALTGSDTRYLDIKKIAAEEFLRHHSEVSEMYRTLNIDISNVETRLFGENQFANLDIIFLLSKAFNRKIYAFQPPYTSVQVYDVQPNLSKNLTPLTVHLMDSHFVPLIAKIGTYGPEISIPERCVYSQVDPAYRVTRSHKKLSKQHLPTLNANEVDRHSLSVVEASDDNQLTLSESPEIAENATQSIPNLGRSKMPSKVAPPEARPFSTLGTQTAQATNVTHVQHTEIQSYTKFLPDEENLHALISDRLSRLQDHSLASELEFVKKLQTFNKKEWSKDLRIVSSTHENKPKKNVESTAYKIFKQQKLQSAHPKVLLLLQRDLHHNEAIANYCRHFNYNESIVKEMEAVGQIEHLEGAHEPLLLQSPEPVWSSPTVPANDVFTTPVACRRSTRAARPPIVFTPSFYDTVMCNQCKKNVTHFQARAQCVQCELVYHQKCIADFTVSKDWICEMCAKSGQAAVSECTGFVQDDLLQSHSPNSSFTEEVMPNNANSDLFVDLEGRTSSDTSSTSLETDSDSESEPKSPILDMDQLAEILGISDEQKNYSPPDKFNIEITVEEMQECFDFKSNKFIEKEWGDVISSADPLLI